MIKHTVFIVSLLMLSMPFYAQMDPGKAVKKAAREVAAYNLDPTGNADKLVEAKELIDGAMQSDAVKNDSKAWSTYGEVYTAVMNADVRALVVNPEHEISDKNASVKAYKGYRKAFETAEKRFERKDAFEGMRNIYSNINYLGNLAYQAGDFNTAYNNFSAVLDMHEILDKEDKEGLLTEDEYKDQVYYSGLAAWSARMWEQAETHFMQLRKMDYDDPNVYVALYNVYHDQGKTEMAHEMLNEGKEKYPENTELLFADINQDLEEGNLDVVDEKLKKAWEAAPENVSIPTTLGNVYDQLYQKAVEEGDMKAAERHFKNAYKYYNEALKLDPEHFDAIYSIGALEYNKAVFLAQEVNALADDYSKEGTTKYEAKKAEMMEQFDVALPYFTRAEEINPNDLNTLIALKEIYARKDQFELSNKYKERIDAMQQN